jgi:hypothetical protein
VHIPWWGGGTRRSTTGPKHLAAALHHPVRQGQGIALSGTKAAAKSKEHHKSEGLETNIGSIKLQLGKLKIVRPGAGLHYQYYMGGETKKGKNNVCMAR